MFIENQKFQNAQKDFFFIIEKKIKLLKVLNLGREVHILFDFSNRYSTFYSTVKRV